MKNLLTRFWRDDAGFVVSSELVLVATILVIGMIAGLTTLRDGVVQELGDVASAFGAVSQTYQYNGVQGHSGATAGSTYVDQLDFCDVPVDPGGSEPACLVIDGNTAVPTSGDAQVAPVP